MKAFKKTSQNMLYNFVFGFILFALVLSQAPRQGSVYTTAVPDGIKLSILMYHGFTKGGKTSEYVIDAKDFEEDIVFLKENGFEFINTYDLTDYVYFNKPLPKKPVMITFDDGYLNNYTYAYPIIKKHNVKVVISPIAYYVEYYSETGEADPLYTQLRDKEIRLMKNDGLVDFQNHSYNMHSLKPRKGSSIKKNENPEDYIREFYYDLRKAEIVLKDIAHITPHAYVYPFGSYSSESLSVLKCSGYKLTMGCMEGVNRITKNPDCLYMLKRFNRTPKRSARQILLQY